MFEQFPYTDMHQLNLDWIIKIAKDFLDQYTSLQQMIADGEQSLTDLTQDGLNDLQEKADTLQGLLDAWYTEHSTDIANQLADALADLNAWYTLHQNYLDQTLVDKKAAFDAHADEKAAQTIASIPDDYTALSDLVTNLNFIKDVLGRTIIQNHDNIIDSLSGNYVETLIPCRFISGQRRNRTMYQKPNISTISICSQIIYSKDPHISLFITVPSGYKALFAFFDSDGDYVGYLPAAGYVTGTFTVSDINSNYFAFEIRKTDESDLDPADFDADSFIVKTAFTNTLAFDNLVNKANRANLDIYGLRKAIPSYTAPVALPNFSFLSGIDLSLLQREDNFICSTDLSRLKHNMLTHAIWYCHDQTALNNALNNMSSGDTIILDGGVYTRFPVVKSMNVIGYNAIISDYVLGAFESTATPNVYKTSVPQSSITGSGVVSVYDISRVNEGILQYLTRVNSSSDLSKPGTCYYNGTTLYVHLCNNQVASNKNVAIVTGRTNALIEFNTQIENATLYMEGLTVIGGSSAFLGANTPTYTNQKVIAKDCKFYCSYSADNVQLLGVYGYFQNCDASYANVKDGFNYHIYNSVPAKGLELYCMAHDNGLADVSSEPSQNGSTGHDGAEILRIGGVYARNNGANVCDIGGSTSYNYDCVAFDSKSSNALTNADFQTNTSATMYVIGCRAIGDSGINLYNRSGTLYHKYTEFDTSSSVTPMP